ncbi:hypothetical protein EMIT074MI3_11483 [Bacillus licheniformis]
MNTSSSSTLFWLLNVQTNKPSTVNAKITLTTVKKVNFVTHLNDFDSHVYIPIVFEGELTHYNRQLQLSTGLPSSARFLGVIPFR